jgi:hypothetical protein
MALGLGMVSGLSDADHLDVRATTLLVAAWYLC